MKKLKPLEINFKYYVITADTLELQIYQLGFFLLFIFMINFINIIKIALIFQSDKLRMITVQKMGLT